MTGASSNLFPWAWPLSWPTGASLAPEQLAQQFLNGSSLINITTNNSSAPDTERRIVAQDSYGRQIGRLLDAVAALIAERASDAPDEPAFVELADLRKRIAATKLEAATDRLTRIKEDLELLKASDPDSYATQCEALRAIL